MSEGSPQQRLRQDCKLPLVVPAVAPSLPLASEWAPSQPEVRVTTMQVAAGPHPILLHPVPAVSIILAKCMGQGLSLPLVQCDVDQCSGSPCLAEIIRQAATSSCSMLAGTVTPLHMVRSSSSMASCSTSSLKPNSRAWLMAMATHSLRSTRYSGDMLCSAQEAKLAATAARIGFEARFAIAPMIEGHVLAATSALGRAESRAGRACRV